MLNPDSGFVSHGNNLPVGSWYPYDLGIGSGGTGHSSRSHRLVQLLRDERLFTPAGFESEIHRDDVQANIALLFPIAQRVAAETGATDRGVQRLLDQLKGWDLRYRADQPHYPAAMALASGMLTPFRRSPLKNRTGGGGGGISHLARLLGEQYGNTEATPTDPEARQYLMDWLTMASENLRRGQGVAPAPEGGVSRDVQRMPYQENGPMRLPVLEPEHNLTSPPLSCGQIGTIWSQKGNSYTQIVDLADIDNSRAVLPPGTSEDPASPFHSDQMPLWVEGTTRPAPLSRTRVEELAASTASVAGEPYDVAPLHVYSADLSGTGLAAASVQRIGPDGAISFEAVARLDEETGAITAVPIDLGQEGQSVYLVLYGTGIRDRSSPAAVTVSVGDIDVPVLYAGPQGFYENLDQVNVFFPPIFAGSGLVNVTLWVDGHRSNSVQIFIG
jgi:uncharacterized protein (TIGR03437 family)